MGDPNYFDKVRKTRQSRKTAAAAEINSRSLKTQVETRFADKSPTSPVCTGCVCVFRLMNSNGDSPTISRGETCTCTWFSVCRGQDFSVYYSVYTTTTIQGHPGGFNLKNVKLPCSAYEESLLCNYHTYHVLLGRLIVNPSQVSPLRMYTLHHCLPQPQTQQSKTTIPPTHRSAPSTSTASKTADSIP